MKKVVVVYKNLGKTPLDAVRDFKKTHPKYENVVISYAGRLDPMAEGVLLLLIGGENKKRENYQNLNKEYEAEIVLGITTDTFDALGMINKIVDVGPGVDEQISGCLGSFIGKNLQKYPPYSSKPVNGKPLYWWAREGKISDIEIPQKEIEIDDIKLVKTTVIAGPDLSKEVVEKINLVEGDFRQKQIIKEWKKFGSEKKDNKFFKFKLVIRCSSGTYVRRFASDIGDKIGCGAFALSIKRTRIGNYSLADSING